MSLRPNELFPYFASVQSLPRIGPKLAVYLQKIGIGRVIDLLFYRPVSLIDRRHCMPIADIKSEGTYTLKVTVHGHITPARRGLPYRVLVSDDSSLMDLVYFNLKPEMIKTMLPEGSVRVISGQVQFFQGKPQMTHPDHVVELAQMARVARIEPLYPLTAGLHQKTLDFAIGTGLTRLTSLPEWLDPAMKTRRQWSDWDQALRRIHTPQSEEDLSPLAPHRLRLAYDEILANQLTLEILRRYHKEQSGRAFHMKQPLREKALSILPFTLTQGQLEVLSQIDTDMQSPERMIRLLQGDVGSGKTILAFLAALNAIGNGAQVALMAPTEILARQHLASLTPLAEKIGINLQILTGREKGKNREAILADIASGNIQLIVGTHALFQEKVIFKDLGLVIIDEQHRFGVEQRLNLQEKGYAADLLVMTATPIPRTLVMAAYGDLDVSKLTEKPPGRQKIETRVMPLDKMADLVAGLTRALEKGAKVYWVCPLIEESDSSSLTAVQTRYEALQAFFGDKVALVHGRMKAAEKDQAMQDFAFGNKQILVATTVIEVGVDVPAATIIIIEHAQRFGLSALHQLRGRVGRGKDASSCILLYGYPLTQNGKERLRVMRESDDGFYIAEEDLKLRGAGEVLGTRQSGLPDMKMADLELHHDLVETARNDAQLILANDPKLESPRGQAIRILLHLFERGDAIRYAKTA